MHSSVAGRLGLLALLPAVLSAACGGGASSRTFTDADRVAIEEVINSQRDAWNRGDLEGYMAGYERSPALVFTSGGAVRRGWEETFRRYKKRYGQKPGEMGTLAFTYEDIRGLGADGAVVLGRWELKGTPKAGRGVFSLALTRGPDGWRVVHDHTSLTPEDEGRGQSPKPKVDAPAEAP